MQEKGREAGWTPHFKNMTRPLVNCVAVLMSGNRLMKNDPDAQRNCR